MECPNRINGFCLLGNDIAIRYGATPGVPCADDAFKACCKHNLPNQINHVVASLTHGHLSRNKQLTAESIQYLSKIIMTGCTDGPGTELHNLLLRKNYPSDVNNGECPSCLSMIRKMNEQGLGWCHKNIMTEIVPAMVAESYRRNLAVTIAGKKIKPPELLRQLQAERWVKQALRSYQKRTANAPNDF